MFVTETNNGSDNGTGRLCVMMAVAYKIKPVCQNWHKLLHFNRLRNTRTIINQNRQLKEESNGKGK